MHKRKVSSRLVYPRYLHLCKAPRVVISRNNDEVNEMLDIKVSTSCTDIDTAEDAFLQRAIEESKKTALREDRARRYENRLLQKTPPSGAVSSGSENNNGVHLPSKTQEPLITILVSSFENDHNVIDILCRQLKKMN